MPMTSLPPTANPDIMGLAGNTEHEREPSGDSTTEYGLLLLVGTCIHEYCSSIRMSILSRLASTGVMQGLHRPHAVPVLSPCLIYADSLKMWRAIQSYEDTHSSC